MKQSIEVRIKCISKELNDKIRVLFLKNNDPGTENAKELNKCNNSVTSDNSKSNLFALTVYTFYKNVILKILVLVKLYTVVIIQLIFSYSVIQTMSSVSANNESEQVQDGSSDSGGITGFFSSSFSCLSGKDNSNCIQRIFLLMSLFGTFLSLIGGIFSLLYRVAIILIH